MVYFAGPATNRNYRTPPAIAEPATPTPGAFSADQFDSPWYVAALKADRVWKEHKITGKGVLNVIHDSNFILSPGILANRYRNPKEQANRKDDSGNGLVDDLHGFDFLLGRAQLTRSPIPRNGRVSTRTLHGHQCVAIICARGSKESPHQFGLAPESQWAGVLANRRIEAAVEWAIEQGADTYSMSFSRPNLREFRSHWRKIMEHGTYCGVHFVSGAGNFAVKGSPQYAPIPVQMRVPEDIPNVVFAAAGVQRDLSRTPFSSQGPVEWKTAHYQDGKVDKPEVGAFNHKLPLLLPNGTVIAKASSGNSFAGPMFCGTIALVLSANPELKPWEVREIIISTATDVGPKGYDHQTGHGLINAFAAVAEAIKRRKAADPDR
jgi:subtilisin family serine protease